MASVADRSSPSRILTAPDSLRSRLDGLRWGWVPYRRPGLPLMRAVADGIADAPDVLLLANHGVIVGAETCAAAEALLRVVEARLDTAPRRPPAPDRGVLARHGAAIGFDGGLDEPLHALATDPVSLRLFRGGALCPDQVVFLGPAAPSIGPKDDPRAALDAYHRRFGIAPDYLVVAGAGVLASGGLSRGAEEMLRCLALALARFPADAAPRHLGDGDVAALIGWEAEAYRKALDRPARD